MASTRPWGHSYTNRTAQPAREKRENEPRHLSH
uniref:Uncharacterized protein n=1 Tax=Siphoviridae sp. ctio73 TaxID=2826435 RepID=A0A8S5MX63_9CAUD|nr:MAG TPA: hypothetical protein [Siphoviridae sp. ctio73]